jgi:transposase
MCGRLSLGEDGHRLVRADGRASARPDGALRGHSRSCGWAVVLWRPKARNCPGDRVWRLWDAVGMRRRNPPPPLADRLLPDALWQRIQPLLPPPPGGGAPRTVPDRACMAAILFMARTSTPWALLPVRELGCGSVTTCWNRFAEWARAGVFDRLQELLLDELGTAGLLDWSRASVDSVSLRAVRGGPDWRQSGRSGQAREQVPCRQRGHGDGAVAAARPGQPA